VHGSQVGGILVVAGSVGFILGFVGPGVFVVAGLLLSGLGALIVAATNPCPLEAPDDILDDVVGVGSDADDEARSMARQPGKPQTEQTGDGSDPVGVSRDARIVEPARNVKPAEVAPEPGGEDDRRDARRREVERRRRSDRCRIAIGDVGRIILTKRREGSTRCRECFVDVALEEGRALVAIGDCSPKRVVELEPFADDRTRTAAHSRLERAMPHFMRPSRQRDDVFHPTTTRS
jgi:hypothetical protein